jgi:hypothetical protein
MITRRVFLKRAALTGGALATATTVIAPLAALPNVGTASTTGAGVLGAESVAAPGVLAFFDGQLWLDTSGLSNAYQPPLGARAAEPLATLTDAELYSARIYL